MSDIPEEAVEAAIRAYNEADRRHAFATGAERVAPLYLGLRAALEAALPHLNPDPWAAQMQTLAEENARLREDVDSACRAAADRTIDLAEAKAEVARLREGIIEANGRALQAENKYKQLREAAQDVESNLTFIEGAFLPVLQEKNAWFRLSDVLEADDE
jgi:hypothetical protein